MEEERLIRPTEELLLKGSLSYRELIRILRYADTFSKPAGRVADGSHQRSSMLTVASLPPVFLAMQLVSEDHSGCLDCH